MKKPSIETVLTFAVAIVSGITGFISSINDQKKEKIVADLVTRVTKLEGK